VSHTELIQLGRSSSRGFLIAVAATRRERNIIYSGYLHKMISQRLNRICCCLTTRQYIYAPWGFEQHLGMF